MSQHPSEPRRRALAYLKGKREIVTDLGAGTDGYVFSLEPYSVVKVHIDKRRFYNELNAYLRLREDKADEIGDFHIPQLQAYDEDHLIVEMSYVKPPYLIDFGKSRLDQAPDFSPEVWQQWREKIEEDFGENADMAFFVFDQMKRKHGIYHLDLSPYNLNFGDEAFDSDGSELT